MTVRGLTGRGPIAIEVKERIGKEIRHLGADAVKATAAIAMDLGATKGLISVRNYRFLLDVRRRRIRARLGVLWTVRRDHRCLPT